MRTGMILPTKMNAMIISEPGGPEVLKPAVINLPVRNENEILIKVTSAGVNGPDLVQRRGLYPPPKGASSLLGLEVSGEVVEVGELENSFKIGEHVCALTNGGGYAEYVVANKDHCLKIPKGVTKIDAAGLPETYFTVWSNLFFQQSIKPGANLLIHGGSGGIGSTAIQIGNALGLNVFATADSDSSCKYCIDLGAKQAINFKNEDFVTILRDVGGADIILDIIGGDYISRNIKASRHDARIIQLAFNQGSKVTIDLMPIMLKRLHLTGSTLRSRPDTYKAEIATDLSNKIWPFFGSKKIKSTTYKTFKLSDVVNAHQLMESGTHRGKILLKI